MNEGRKSTGLIQFVLLICLVNTVICHYIPQDISNDGEGHHRSRRDLEADDKICGALDKAGSIGSLISKIPIPFIGEIFDTALTVATFGLKSNYLETDCSDVPFEKIKKEMRERFDKLDAKVDRNFVAINQLYTEIHRLFDKVEKSQKNSDIQPILSGMKMFIEGFSSYRSEIDVHFNDGNLVEVESKLQRLRNAINRIDGQLSKQVNEILNRNFAIPEDGDDDLSMLALNALYYGVQAHVSVLLFLVEKYSLLAEKYYNNRDFENYHEQLGTMKVVFSDLKALTSKNSKTHVDNNVFGNDFETALAQKNTLIDEFYNTAELAERSISLQRRDSDKALKDSIDERIEALKKTNNEISQLVLSIMKETPKLLRITIRNQAEPSAPLRVLADKSQVTVTYAMQYKCNSASSYYMVSDWTAAYSLDADQYAEINLPNVPADIPAGTIRLIFRQISSGHQSKRSELVGVIEDRKQKVFKDVHRDLYNAARTGSHNIVSTAIKNGANVNAIFDKGRRPLHAALEARSKKVIEALLQNGGNIDIQDENGYTPLHLAAKLGYFKFCQFLLTKGADGKLKSKPEGLTPLHVAVIYNQLSAVNALIPSSKIDANLGDNNGDTPLHYAVNISQSAVAALIANGKVDVSAKNNEGVTPLHYAVANKAENIASTLLSNERLNANVISNNKMSPLHMAILDSSSPMTTLLLNNAGVVDVNVAGPEDLTPLHFAVMAGNQHFTTLLIQKGANLAAVSKSRWTPLHYAITLRDVNMTRLLLNNSQVKTFINLITEEGYTALHMYASAFEDNEVTSKLLNNIANVDAKTNEGFTPLHIAAVHNKKGIVSALLPRANNNEKTRDGRLFWELAGAKDSIDAIKFFILYSLTEKEQRDLVNIALKSDSAEVLKYLLEVKKVSYDWEGRQDLLYTAVVHNSTKASKCIIDIIDSKGQNSALVYYHKSFLLLATKNQNFAIVKYLMDNVSTNSDYYLDFRNQRYEYVDEHGNKKKRTALHEAVYAGNIPLIMYLIRYVDIYIKDDRDKTAADIAKERGLQDMYLILNYRDTCNDVRNKKKIANIQNDFVKSRCYQWETESYTSPLHQAITHDNNIAKDLVEKGADVNSLDVNRNTPLNLALAKKKFDLAEIIVQKSPDVRIKNNKKEKAIDLAREHGAPEKLIAKIQKLEHELNVKDGFAK